MTVKTFWTFLIKILGIWLVLEGFIIIPKFISTLLLSEPNITRQGFYFSFASVVLTTGFYLFILRLFVFKTAWLIDILHLEKGFEEQRIDLNIQLPTLLRIAVIIIGGLLFVDSLPHLCSQAFVLYQQNSGLTKNSTSAWIVFYLLKTVIGYLLMINSKKVVALIIKLAYSQNDNNDTPLDTELP